MKSNHLGLALMAFAIYSVGSPFSVFADLPGVHPNYVQAMSDLRTAKQYLARPDTQNAQADELSAMEELDFCLRDLNAAATVDGKNTAAAPVVDAGFKGNRIARALELIGKAQVEISGREDDAAVLKARQSAIKHLEVAANLARKAFGDDAQRK